VDELSIKVSIGGRTYPLTIQRDEEEIIRKAAKKVDDTLLQFQKSYAVRDKQDLLAMTALQMATMALKSGDKPASPKALEELQAVHDLLANHLS
jgi:cell division protein ZapA